MESFTAFLTVLIWPLTILIVAVVFRSQLVQTIGRLASFKYGEFEVGFNNELRRAEAEARSSPTPPEAVKAPSGSTVLKESDRGPGAPRAGTGSSDVESLYRLAILTPRAAIREAWQRVEQALREAAWATGVADRSNALGWDDAARRLAELGVLTASLRARVDRLRILFEWAARAPELESSLFADHARRYIDLTREVMAPLQVIVRKS
ncbi:MAG TPA: hypothetical protein VGZ22_12225 [Isosphaeraceae bacterium]|nr:hypothetical protein [Isosphaeraceae bacterium]